MLIKSAVGQTYFYNNLDILVDIIKVFSAHKD